MAPSVFDRAVSPLSGDFACPSGPARRQNVRSKPLVRHRHPTRGARTMRVRIQVVVEPESDAVPLVHEVATLERDGLQPEGLGLTLAEAKDLLRGVQETMVAAQVAAFEAQQACCPDCGRARRRNGRHEIVYRTLFGKLRLDSRRFYACPCHEAAPRAGISLLAERLPERTAPELSYLESKFAALMSYGLTVDVLAEILPLGAELAQTSVRRQVQRVAERAEGELGDEQFSFIEGCQRDWDQLPRPDPPLTVGLDGGYVHARYPKSRTEGCFEVIAGKVLSEEGDPTCFAFVPHVDAKPKRRLFEVLKARGLQMNQRVEFLTDGGDTVRELPLYLCPESEHWLDWFHVTMRLTVMGQLAKGLALERVPVGPAGDDGEEEEVGQLDVPALEKQLESLKWHLWHGNVYRALQIIEDLECESVLSQALNDGQKMVLPFLSANRGRKEPLDRENPAVPHLKTFFPHISPPISVNFRTT